MTGILLHVVDGLGSHVAFGNALYESAERLHLFRVTDGREALAFCIKRKNSHAQTLA